MDRITASKVFVTIVERGSMVAAADLLGMSRSMVTRYLAQMEDWAGAQLLHRSTRKLSLTGAGESVLEHCRELLQVADALPVAQDAAAEYPSGNLRVSCSPFVAEYLLLPAVCAYLQRFPKVSVELQLTNETVNLVDDRIDLAIRIASDIDPNLIARPLGECHSVLCASPGYLSSHGIPSSPEQLAHHNCLIYSYFGKRSVWHLRRQKETVSVAVGGQLVANESMVLLRSALLGVGITMQPEHAAAPHIEAGRLVTVLPEYKPMPLGIYGVYRSRKHQSLALRTLLDELVEHFKELA